MSTFSDPELAYLTGERRLARIATADSDGMPHVTPVGVWRYDAARDCIEVGGREFANTKKYRNVEANPQASIVIDDLASTNPWRPRAVMVQGRANAIPRDGQASAAVIRIHPDTVVSWGLEA